MGHWWRHEVIDAHKLPLMLCFLAFVVTFLVTRMITRMIRAGRGPFHDNVSGGTHIHHSVPGLILLIVGAFVGIGSPGGGPWAAIAATAVGIGVSLVLDEFALILHLQDVYWSGEGQLSVNIVSLTAACLGLALVTTSPVGVNGLGDAEQGARLALGVTLTVHGLFLLTCVLKRKYRLALIGLFVPLVGEVAAVRLARPGSRWARRFYGAKRTERATRRAATMDRRWQPWLTRWDDLIGGAPSLPDPARPSPTPSTGAR